MIEAILGLGSAAAFSASNVISRRGLLHASPSFIANVSICSGPIFFLIVTLLTGDLFKLAGYSWKVYTFFALSGIIHFALGRTYSFKSTQLLGSTRSNTITGLNVIVTVILAGVILGEAITPRVVLGILLSLAGPILITVKGWAAKTGAQVKASPQGQSVQRRTLYVGMLYGLGGGIFWGVSPLFAKLGIENGGAPLAGTLIAYAAASLVVGPWVLNAETRRGITGPDKKALQLALMSGLSSNTAQMLRYLALGYGSLIVVSMMGRTTPIWTLLLAFAFNRKYESFSRWVLLGNVLLLAGTVIVLT